MPGGQARQVKLHQQKDVCQIAFSDNRAGPCQFPGSPKIGIRSNSPTKVSISETDRSPITIVKVATLANYVLDAHFGQIRNADASQTVLRNSFNLDRFDGGTEFAFSVKAHLDLAQWATCKPYSGGHVSADDLIWGNELPYDYFISE
jgi:hypothetical protein